MNNKLKLLTDRQNDHSKRNWGHGDIDSIIKDMLWYAKEYECSNAEAVNDMDYPVCNEDRLELEKRGYLETYIN